MIKSRLHDVGDLSWTYDANGTGNARSLVTDELV